jgi:hypothetical protein
MGDVDAISGERAEAVRAFDAAYGHMEGTLWTLSQACRPWLLRGEESPILDELVWTLKSWWGVQGVRSETKRAMGAALASLEWAPEFFRDKYLPAGERKPSPSGQLRTWSLRPWHWVFNVASTRLHRRSCIG